MTQLDQATTSCVQANLDALLAQRQADWPADRLAANAALRQGLEAAADRARFVAVGDDFPGFEVDEVDGGTLSKRSLTEQGPAVLLFFRFEGCPACNAALAGYRDTLAGALAELGVPLVAISPQEKGRLGAIKHRLALPFFVASDPDATLIEAIGIGFSPAPEERDRQRAAGNDLGETLGTGGWVLPYPTAVIIDRAGVVRLADVHPDWMVRTEADTIIATVRALLEGEA